MRVARFLKHCWILFLIVTPAWAQSPKPLLPQGSNVVSSDWQRALEALRNARPMPTPPEPAAPGVAMPPGNLQQFDPANGNSSSLPPGNAANSADRRREGNPGVKPNSAVRGPGESSGPAPEGVSQPEDAGTGVHPQATVPGPSFYPYTYPSNTVFKLVGRWVVNGVNYYWVCSASSASSFHLITAGHCLYNHDPTGNGSGQGANWPAEMWAWPAQTDVVDPLDHSNWQDWPYGVTKGTLFTTYNAWITSSDLNWDFGWITLDRRVGDHLGWMGREWNTQTTALNFNGYPMESPYVPSDNPFQYPGFDPNNVTSYTCCRINMSAYTYGGHSGGPDWRFDGTSRWVQGVNSTSNRAGSATATRLTSQIETDLENTIAADRSARPPVDLAEPIEYVFNGVSKGLSQSSVQIGSSFGLTLNAFNAGYIDAGNTTADVYLTTNPNSVGSGYYIGTHQFGYIGTYQFAVQSGSLRVPLTVPPASYFVGYVLGAANSSYGSDKNVVVVSNQMMNVYCNSDVYEPDQNAGQAKQLAASGSQNHTICGPTDQDWVYFTVAQTSGATLWTSGSAGDTTLTLYNSQLQQVAFNDDSGGTLFSTINRTCGVNALPAGTYYAVVQSYANASVVPAYSLNLSLTPCPALSAVSMAASVVGGNPVTATVTLTLPASGNGLAVQLASNTGAAAVPTSVLVGSGATTATFTVNTSPVAVATAATITASYDGVVKTANLNVNPPAANSLSLTPNPIQGGNDATGTVSLNGPAPAGGTAVALSSSTKFASVPPTVTVLAGATSAQFNITTVPAKDSGEKRTSVITASAGGASVSATLTIQR